MISPTPTTEAKAGPELAVAAFRRSLSLFPFTPPPNWPPEKLHGIDIQRMGQLRYDLEADVFLCRLDLGDVRPAHLRRVRKLVLGQSTGMA
jgi:hypothetical protein